MQLSSRSHLPYCQGTNRRAGLSKSWRQSGRPSSVCAAADSSKQPPPVYIEDSATQTFLNWATSAGIQFPRLKPATFNGVRGLAASSDIQVDDVIVSVPRGKALTLPPKQRCPCPDFVTAAYWDASPWYVRLAVRLLHEQGKGQASELREWLQQLPRRVDSPVNWSQELVQQLQYAHLIHKVTEQQQEWSKLYDKFREAAANKGGAPSKQDFFRALSLVRSRTFSGPYVASSLSDRGRLAALVGALVVINTALGGDLSRGLGAAAAVFLFNVIYEVVLSNKLKQYAMCPVIDLLNHSSYNTTEVSYDYPRDAFLVSAGAAYVPGQQVFISYGAQNNDSLMQMYGFAEPNNPYDVYVMSSLLKWLEQLAPVSQGRLDRLNKEGLLGALQEVVVTRQGFGAQTLQALRYLLVPGTSAAAAAPSSSSADSAAAAGGGQSAAAAAAAAAASLPAGPPSSYELPADDDTERKIALVLVHACQQELAVLEDKQSAGSSSSSGGRKRGSTSSSNGSSSRSMSSADVASAQAAAAAFRAEKRKVLIACLEQLTGGSAASSSSSNGAGGAVQQLQNQEGTGPANKRTAAAAGTP